MELASFLVFFPAIAAVGVSFVTDREWWCRSGDVVLDSGKTVKE
jgi:hypothetical protein